MMKLKTMAIALSFIGIGAAGVIVAAPQVAPNRPTPSAARGQRNDRQKAHAPHPHPSRAAGKSSRRCMPWKAT